MRMAEKYKLIQVATLGIPKRQFVGLVFLVIVWTTMAVTFGMRLVAPAPVCQMKPYLTIEDQQRVFICVVETK